ncbi:glycosyltransferase family 2 protein, partial [Campylobacter jejuni]
MSQLSIIIPLFNSYDFILRALQSCINQTLKDIEILIIDDKSKDNSLNIVLEFAKKDPRIKIFQNEENLGTFASRNLGVLHESGLDEFYEKLGNQTLSPVNFQNEMKNYDEFVTKTKEGF